MNLLFKLLVVLAILGFFAQPLIRRELASPTRQVGEGICFESSRVKYVIIDEDTKETLYIISEE